RTGLQCTERAAADWARWLAPMRQAEDPVAAIPPLPTEDPQWGGSGGGAGRREEGIRDWAEELAECSRMEAGDLETRLARDRRLFRLHSSFVDAAVIAARDAAERDSDGSDCEGPMAGPGLQVRLVTSAEAGTEVGEAQSEAAVLKGLTADKNTVARDTPALSRVVVHHCGRAVEVLAAPLKPAAAAAAVRVAPEDEPAAQHGGAHALNVSSLRSRLHMQGMAPCGEAEVTAAVKRALTPLASAPAPGLRWELGVKWLQHAKDQKEEGAEKVLQSDRTPLPKDPFPPVSEAEAADAVAALTRVVGDEAVERLQKEETGLERIPRGELLKRARWFYENIALVQFVADCKSLEVSPVDGRTLSDFMHSRGLSMRSLGRVANMARDMLHVRHLCVAEMVARVLKHLLRDLLRLTKRRMQAAAVAAVLNGVLGNEEAKGQAELWAWVEAAVLVRYGHKVTAEERGCLRALPLLRSVCLKTGLELRPSDFDFSTAAPFLAADVLAAVPVCKHVAYTTADGRALLESSKAALDKSNVEEAVTFGTKALHQ
ncbi:hypothetical protein CYMTET_5771, partial [Cymbomonas tetramitiformis]